MGHRLLFGTSQMFEGEHEQGWNHMHTEQPYANIVRASTTEHGSFFCPVENMSVDAVHFSSHQNPVPMSSGYATSSHNVEGPHYQPDTSGPSHDLFLHSSAPGAFGASPEDYMPHASSSNYDTQTSHGIEGGFVDLTMGGGRGPHKRKSPGIPSVCERGGSSRYVGAGSSSDLPLSSDFWQEKPNIDPQHMHWDHFAMPPSYRGNGLSIRGDGSMRNVRSRPALDLESNLVRSHLSSNPSHTSYSTSHQVDHSSSVDLSGQSSNAFSRELEWGHLRMSPTYERIQASDSSVFNNETNHFPGGSSATNASVEIGGLQRDFVSGRNPVLPQSFHGNSAQSVRSVRTNYSQRSGPTFRASSSSVRLGQVAPSDEDVQVVAESYSSRHPRPLSAITWRNNDRNGRSRISNRSLADDAAFHDRFSSEGFMTMDRSAFYGSRNMFDQHRDMRLDIDNMTYEELLALGERIGNVNTGLSEDLVSKCLTETIYCSSDQVQDESSCVICLEEYKDMDEVGALNTCGHDYHVPCIKKWLSMKNACPICKASALAGNMKEK
ncbi:probable E3 ubiquitin-protein ligase ZFP1 [Durio zibethinus]|uniref:RING-type E3 ubiquitin transferase n=1 Tax=Durio zibethinus TaxID=66656 RepID=A0A6P5YY59_DURZI|nr:probable E3 ubiquitin-protein ligase ZFP1 [Durio zibethinus]XP_022745203.1 probable E3 ubiquitin-protein ligase ZFP1 [Durio zibethinus]XP_022745204.1 probable E3 ubiquitin-protein ligase ZFP1 [Durio zibethinus]XP_022745205.1 probable E3 ubiquitin-protein ligase ZFP1 [Durio zibethinus]XP_022745206.1 probable E3 ubiquitin-protein ligase ZFP1 [Durio zibethinus]XP_022745207.1 probable E3 ubiquitin-protein ligase ZFP1 [Durio zibethinus]XP_022745208.1 probable E3 ubiquitin-protein ligase ZFP1 [D